MFINIYSVAFVLLYYFLQAPLKTEVTEDKFTFLTEKSAIPIPVFPGTSLLDYLPYNVLVLLFLDHYSKNYPYTKAFHFIRLLKKDLFLVIILLFLSIFSSRVRVMVFSTTFNNISVISWWSVLLMEDTGVWFKLTTLVVIGTDCMGSYKSNYHNDHDHDSTFFFNYIYKV